MENNQTEINIYKFILSFVKQRKLSCFLWLFFILLTDFIIIFLSQALNRKLITHLDAENFTIKVGFIFVILYVVSNNSTYILKMFKIKTKFIFLEYIKKSVRSSLFAYIVQHSINYFNNSFAGTLNNKIATAIRSMDNVISNFGTILSGIIIFTLIPFFYANISIYISLIFVLGLVICFYFLYREKNKFIPAEKELSNSTSKFFGLINDSFTNISNIKMFSNKEYEKSIINKQCEDILYKEKKLSEIQRSFQLTNFISTFFMFFSTLGMSTYLLSMNKITIADFTFIMIVTSISKFVINNVSKSLTNFYNAVGNLKNALETIYKPINIQDKIGSKKLNVTVGKIVFKNVRFNYGK